MKNINSSILPYYYEYTWPYKGTGTNTTFVYPKETKVANNEEVLKFAITVIENLLVSGKIEDALDIIYNLRDQDYIK